MSESQKEIETPADASGAKQKLRVAVEELEMM